MGEAIYLKGALGEMCFFDTTLKIGGKVSFALKRSYDFEVLAPFSYPNSS